MFHRLTDQTRSVLAVAEAEARAMNHDYVGTEHLLLALISDKSGVVTNLLRMFDVDADRVRREIDRLVERGPQPVTGVKLPLTPRAGRVLEYAADECRFMNERAVGPEHLLLGLLREPDGVAGQALQNLGLQLEKMVHEVFRARLELMKSVERAVRPVRAGTLWKRKTREELLAHLTNIYDEEMERLSDPAAAVSAAMERFGDPRQLAQELESSLPIAERRQYFVERWLGWRAPESAARYMFRQAVQSFSVLAIACALIVAGTLAFAGFHGNMGTIVRGPIAFLVLTPLAQFLLGFFYYKMRDSIYGPAWASKSKPKVVLFGILIGVSFFAGALAFIGFATWDAQRVIEAVAPLAAAAVLVAVAHFILARRRGPIEIADTLWACMDLGDSTKTEAA